MSTSAAAAEPATSPSRSRVDGLVQAHQQAIQRANAQPTSPTQTRAAMPAKQDGESDAAEAADAGAGEEKPSQDGEQAGAGQAAETGGDDKKAADEASTENKEADETTKKDGEAAAAAADRALETVPEGKGGDAPAKQEGDAPKESAEGADKPVEEETDPLGRIRETMQSLGEKEQQVVQANLDRVAQYPAEMPLSTSWTLHFSDTSGTKSASAAAVKDAYVEGISPVFTATSVPALCGSLKAFKQAAGKVSRRSKAPEGESFGLTRPGMNLHFFRTGIVPTWEDEYNAKGGRLTISPSAHLFDSIYERLILLLAGSALEMSASDLLHSQGGANAANGGGDGKKRAQANAAANGAPVEGMVNGVVASRRARGDRIEVWLGGKKRQEPAPAPWIDALKEVLSEELGLPEVRTGKYKKHF